MAERHRRVERRLHLEARRLAWLQHDVRVDALALDGVREAHHAGLRDRVHAHQRRLELRRAHAVAADVEHVVDAPGDPVVAVVVALGTRRR
jgi:hypothetical protein